MTVTKVMCVVGMHRSATSAVAKGLHMAGWPMAPSLQRQVSDL